MLNIDFPFRFDATGSTAKTTWADHQYDMLIQLLLTDPSERVNRPDFGTPLRKSCDEPNGDQLADVVQFMARAGLQRWLGDSIDIILLEASARGNVLEINLHYRIKGQEVVKERQSSYPIRGPQ